jgi:predicted ATPase
VTVSTLWAQGYRSLLDLRVPLGQVTVVVGENGSGKTNLYRVLRLLSHGASGRLARALLEEGGMPSVLWAGSAPRSRKGPVRCVLGVVVDDLAYQLSLGLRPPVPDNPFTLDPQIKDEAAWVGGKRTRHSAIAERAGISATATDVDGAKVAFPALVDPSEPFLAQLGEPARFPELYALRERLRRWRFYHQFPTGPEAPARAPRPGVFTSVLADDGADLAAALATIQEVGDEAMLSGSIAEAFPGCRLHVTGGPMAFTVELEQPGLSRPLTAGELSDGTLRYLYLAAALLSPRPPQLLVFNEPETSLHPTLLRPLARLIAETSRFTQILLTTHATELADELVALAGVEPLRLERSPDGVTSIQPG